MKGKGDKKQRRVIEKKNRVSLEQAMECYGRMNAPTSSAFIKGICGEEMEFYLVIENDILKEVTFYTEGCAYTRICGEITAKSASGKTVSEALGISPKTIIDSLSGMDGEDRHCAILAVSTLYKALADYLLKP